MTTLSKSYCFDTWGMRELSIFLNTQTPDDTTDNTKYTSLFTFSINQGYPFVSQDFELSLSVAIIQVVKSLTNRMTALPKSHRFNTLGMRELTFFLNTQAQYPGRHYG